MQIVALIGPFGAGKSTVGMTLAAFLAKQGYTNDQVAIVVNEAGGITEIRTPHAQIHTLPNGCFTCQDEAVLKTELAKFAEAGIKLVIMEGFGIVAGNETKAFLSAVPYHHAMIGVLPVADWDANIINYSELVATHLTVADAIVVTKHTGELPTAIDNYLKVRHVHAPIVFGTVDTFPPAAWSSVKHALEHHQPGRISCGSGCGHAHSHEHDHGSNVHADRNHPHDHSHGWQTAVLDLRPSTTITTLRSATETSVRSGVMRLKGRLSGRSFNVSPGTTDWQTSVTHEDGDFAICYLKDGEDWPSALLDLVESAPAPARSHQLLRFDTDRNETIKNLNDWMSNLPTWKVQAAEAADGSIRLITHPEPLQIRKEMARRPNIKSTYFGPVIKICLEYWVTCAEWLNENAASVSEDHLATNQRELGVSLAWWALEFEDQLPDELLARARAVQPALMVAAGLRDVTKLREDPFWRYWQGLEYLRALRFGLEELPEPCQADAISTAKRVVTMAVTEQDQLAFTKEFPMKEMAAA